jgi:hypothetical protein
MTAQAPTTAADIAEYFRRLGQAFDMLDADTLCTRMSGKATSFIALVHVTEHWVVIAVEDFATAPDDGYGPVALRFLVTANHRESIVKFGLDESEEVFVHVELPAEGMSFELFAAAFATLSEVADRLFIPLLQAVVIDERNSA